MSSGDLIVPDDRFFAELFSETQGSAIHLELRDSYMLDELYERWMANERPAPLPAEPDDRAWMDTVGEAVARGVRVRRARIVSEPVSTYIAYEHAATAAVNIAAGEEVRWLPRRDASMLALPGNDFWVFDDRTVVWNHFAGDGAWLGAEVTQDPAAASFCTTAFEAVWAQAIDHADYSI